MKNLVVFFVNSINLRDLESRQLKINLCNRFIYIRFREAAICRLVEKVDDAILFADTEFAFVENLSLSLCRALRFTLLDFANENNK